MRKKIIIVIDNPSRDLAASILIARELAKDHCIYLCSTASLFYEIFRLNPDLVLLNYLRITHLSLIRKLIDCSIQYSVLDTEGGVFAKINEQESSYTKTIVTDARVRNHLLRYYAWGLNLQQELLKNKIYSAQQIRCLGTPRSDFYHLSFMSFYDCPKDSLASQSKQSVILINTSFSLINPKFTTAINEQKSLKEKLLNLHTV